MVLFFFPLFKLDELLMSLRTSEKTFQDFMLSRAQICTSRNFEKLCYYIGQ